MNKKGISPFIATVLLIGMVTVVGVFLLSFYSAFSDNQTGEIEDQTYITRLCIEKTDLNLGNSCYVPDIVARIRLDVENEGPYPISSINFTFYTGIDIVGTYELTMGMSKYGHQVIGYFEGEEILLDSLPEKVGYTKYLNVSGKIVMCDPAYILVEFKEC
jgi:hypothetical protein